MNISLFYQPDHGQLGELIQEQMALPYTRLTIWSAFAKSSGILRLKPALQRFKKREGAQIRAFIGVDAGGTSLEAMEALRELCDELYVIHSDHDSATFHPKMYILENEEQMWAAIGSNNLTGGGLWSNIESAFVCQCGKNPEEEAFAAVCRPLEELAERYRDPNSGLSLQIQSQKELEILKECGYLRSEASVCAKERAGSASRPVRLFSGKPLAPLPPLESGAAGSERETESDSTHSSAPAAGRLWMETRELTGGSANQLEPSANGVLLSGSAAGTVFESRKAGHIKGSIVYFGLDPDDSDCVKQITIRYNGSDYVGCVIEHKRGNSNWRIMLKGKNDKGKEIQSSGETGWLKRKLLVFEKLSEDCYRMTVYDESRKAEFESNSVFYGANGRSRSNRRYGLLI